MTDEFQLHRATETRSGRFVCVGESVVGSASERDERFGSISGSGHDKNVNELLW